VSAAGAAVEVWAWAALAAKSSVPMLAEASRYLALVMLSLPLFDLGSSFALIFGEIYTYQSIRQADFDAVYDPQARSQHNFGILLVLYEGWLAR
jgi:hypothetical protein